MYIFYYFIDMMKNYILDVKVNENRKESIDYNYAYIIF